MAGSQEACACHSGRRGRTNHCGHGGKENRSRGGYSPRPGEKECLAIPGSKQLAVHFRKGEGKKQSGSRAGEKACKLTSANHLARSGKGGGKRKEAGNAACFLGRGGLLRRRNCPAPFFSGEKKKERQRLFQSEKKKSCSRASAKGKSPPEKGLEICCKRLMHSWR